MVKKICISEYSSFLEVQTYKIGADTYNQKYHVLVVSNEKDTCSDV